VKDLFAQYENTFVAFCELLNNSIQAKAKNIQIEIEYAMEDEVYPTALKKIVIMDDGNGVALSDLDDKILKIGTSAKHGGRGIGRFAALQIGSEVEIQSVSFDHKLDEFTEFIVPLKQSLFKADRDLAEIEVETTEKELHGKHIPYYKVTIEDIYDSAVWKKFPETKLNPNFLKQNIKKALFERYPLIIFNQITKIYINSEFIDPNDFIQGEPEKVVKSFKSVRGESQELHFNFIHLKPELNQIKVFITVNNAGVQTVAGTFDYDANWLSPKIGSWFIYISSEYFTFDILRNLDISGLDEDAKQLKSFIQESVDEFFKGKNKEFDDFTKELKKDEHYPYRTRKPSSSTKQVVFDKLAFLIEEKHHILMNRNSLRELIYPLVDKAIANGGFKTIIANILKLDDALIQKFNDLLERVELEDVISFSEQVSRKIDDLELLEKLIYSDLSKHVLERKQLHKILEHMLWIFGEQYNDSTRLLSDKNLGTNLEELRNKFLKFERDDSEDNYIEYEDKDIKSITDLFLYSEKILDEKNREVLIVELKAPYVKISAKELTQVKRYADEIEERGVFPNRLKYKIFLVGAELTKRTKKEIKGTETTSQKLYFYWSNESQNIEIYVIEWSEFIESTKRKLNYMASQLRIKDLSVQEKIAKDFTNINVDEFESRLKKSKTTLA